MAPPAWACDGYPELRFRCRCCGFCCSYFDVTATTEEVARVGKLSLPGGTAGRDGFSPLSDRLFTIDKNETHHCRFMDDQGLCLIHRTAGVEAKPIACRLFPFSIHTWADGRISADLRFICPAVGDPEGTRLADHAVHIRTMAQLLTAREKYADTVYSRRNPAPLARVRRVHEGYQAILSAEEYPWALRLYSVAKIIAFHDRKSMFPAIAAAEAGFCDEAMAFVRKAEALLSGELKQAGTPGSRERMEFRSLVGGYLRDDNAVDTGVIARLIRMRHFVAFVLGGGSLRRLNPSCPETTGIACPGAAGGMPLSPDAVRLFNLFFYGKLYSMHFCSRYVHGYTYELGLRHLLLTAPVAHAIAAMFARTAGCSRVDGTIMRQVLTYIDTSFILSPYFRQQQTIKRLRFLTAPKVFAALLKDCLP
ncbi:MAG: YkgJ family cysteine cluster protein [Victivallales bacterium]|nr:YkgJ family cysteine cluster protein [Victivallales bacterium]